VENPDARATDKPWEQVPSAYGAHNWHPMSFNPGTGLVYIPAQGVPLVVEHDPEWENNAHIPGRPHSNLGWNLGFLVSAVPPEERPFGQLIAWDPVAKKAVWTQDHVSPWNGGTLTTAGNLVFQGTADGGFVAYDARTGEVLWQTPVGSGVVAGPATYEIDGVQYVTVAVGWGGVYGISQRATDRVGPGRVWTFRLDGEAEPPEMTIHPQQELVAGVAYDPEDVPMGGALYISNCVFCHGVPGVNNGGNVPNLGYSEAATLENAAEILLTGGRLELGMPHFEGKLTEEEIEKIVAFIQGTADALR
jgi:quinohemoprotein ethanol dehydrogenase